MDMSAAAAAELALCPTTCPSLPTLRALQTLCHLAKQASSADAVALLDCVQWQLLQGFESAAITLYLQHNAKWADRRLSTAVAWHLLNARAAAHLRRANSRSAAVVASLEPLPFDAALRNLHDELQRLLARKDEGNSRVARHRTVMWGLRWAGCGAVGDRMVKPPCLQQSSPCRRGRVCPRNRHAPLPAAFHRALPSPSRMRCSTSSLAQWHGTVMPCSSATIECACIPPTPEGQTPPMALQLEREDPRHAAAEAVSVVTGGGGAASAGGRCGDAWHAWHAWRAP